MIGDQVRPNNQPQPIPSEVNLIQRLQIENNQLRGEVGRLSGMLNNVDEKYQKSLKEMSSLIHANKNLKN